MKKYLTFSLASFLVTFGLLAITGTANAASSGPLYPLSVVDDSATGTVAWSNPINARNVGSGYATVILNSGFEKSHYLKATNFGFNIPAGSTITGIEVTVNRSQNDTHTQRVFDNSVRLVKANSTILGSEKSVGTAWPNSDGTITYGNSSDLWGQTWSVADINASTTGFALSAIHDNSSNDRTPQVDYIRMTVYFTPAKIVPTIHWPTPSAITYGTALSSIQLNATTSPTVAGSFVYSPISGTVLNAGLSQLLSVLFTPTASTTYSTTTATVNINVNKADQTITWSNPADVPFGTVLSATQLNATTSGPGSIIYSPSAGFTLNTVGNIPLTASVAGDANHNATSTTVQIHVYDNVLPVISVHPDMTEDATSPAGAAVNFLVTSTDNVDGTLPADCTPASGSTFGFGTTSVSCGKTDSSGNVATSTSFVVKVQDITAPVVNIPSDISATSTFASTSVTYTTPSATDDVDGAVAVTCLPESGSSFTVGTHSVTCSATDAHGNTGHSSFNVVVSDTGAPSLTVPGDMTVQATSPSGAVVSFTVTANDDVDGPIAPICTPASGSTFGFGTSSVTCTATDSATNTASAMFNIGVIDTIAPVITLTGDATVNIIVGNPYTDAGATASDNVDGNITPSIITVGGTINTSTTGSHIVTYNVTDAHGNHADQVTRTVNVLAAAPTTGNIRIIKLVQNSNGGNVEDSTPFTIRISGGDEFSASSSVSEESDANFSELSGGTYTITEDSNSNYDLVSISPDQNSELNGAQVNLTLGSTTVVTVINRQHAQATTTEPTPTPNLPTPAPGRTGGGNVFGWGGSVLGASTDTGNASSCKATLFGYMRMGKKNDTAQVKILQQFLNETLGLSIPVTGVFGPETKKAVIAFQLKYAEQILGPWVKAGLLPDNKSATGYVYKTTLRWINLMKCASLNIPVPELK